MRVLKIAFTGGPSAGKSTMFNNAKKYLLEQGYQVLEVPETATQLMNIEMQPKSFKGQNGKIFQDIVYQYQRTKEKCAYAALAYNEEYDTCIILCDRGIIDNIAYLDTKEDFEEILQRYNDSEINILDSYDLVIKLTTLAITKPECYQKKSGKVVREAPERAIELDRRTTEAWLGHHNMHVVDTSKTLEEVSSEVNALINRLIDPKEYVRFDMLFDDMVYKMTGIRLEPIEYDLKKYNINGYDKQNSRTIHIKSITVRDNKNNSYQIFERKYNGDTSYIMSINHYPTKQILESDANNIISKCKIIETDEYDELYIWEDNQLYTIRFKDDKMFLIPKDIDQELPRGITPKTKEKTLKN